MAASSWLPRVAAVHSQISEKAQQKFRSRPFPLRMRTFSDSGPWPPTSGDHRDGLHSRHKSTSTAVDDSELSPRSQRRHAPAVEALVELESPRTSLDDSASDITMSDTSTSPATPLTSLPSGRNSLETSSPEVLSYDFSKIDYELERATVLGKGLWSTVFLAEQKSTPCTLSSNLPPSPSRTQRQLRSGCALFAIKMPARKDSHPIFRKSTTCQDRCL